jgi:hypothetical protein
MSITYNQLKDNTRRSWLKAIINQWRDKNHHHVVKVKLGHESACWMFHNNKHHIYIGDGMFKDSKGNQQKLVESLLCHELGHGLYTQKDAKGVINQAKCMGVSKGLLNLAEDVRIENLFRDFTERSFDWSSLHVHKCTGSPESLLLYIKHLEGAWPIVEPQVVPVLNLINDFYLRFQACATTEDLIPILVEWNDIFKLDENEDESQDNEQNDFSDELNESIKGSKQCEPIYLEPINDLGGDFERIDKDSYTIADTQAEENLKQSKSKPGHELDTDNKNVFAEINKNAEFYLKAPEPIDLKAVQTLTKQCAGAFKTHSAYESTSRPSKRLNIRGIIRGEDEKMYRAKQSKSKSKLKTNLIIDCSGSMRGEPIESARTIIAIFSNLAKQGYIQGNVILTRGDCISEVIPMPLKPDDIGLIANVHYSEGLKETFDHNLSIMADAKINFIVTDGGICDGDINKRYYSKKGVKTFGLYVGEHSDDGELLRWFDRGVARKTIESLIAVMVRNLKKSL